MGVTFLRKTVDNFLFVVYFNGIKIGFLTLKGRGFKMGKGMGKVIGNSLIVVCVVLGLCLELLFAQATPVVTPTPQAPTVETGEATLNDELYSLTLNGIVNAHGLSTTVWFEYGTSSGLYSDITSTQTVSGTSDITANIKISASEETGYYYRIVAQNSAGISYGNEMYFIVPIDTWWWEATKSMEVSPTTPIIKKDQSKDVVVTITWGYGFSVGGENIEVEVTAGKRRVSISPKSAVTDENGQAKFTILGKRVGKAKITFKVKRGNYGELKTEVTVKVRR
ncbi:MAG: hypothetical protein A3G70_00505 [Planctomycetes bacterium RIFCSPLOWO2_12_FULL_39_13]|nr:MAG: hypothetical protein A3G70_00505 [Planctomycetes bacterium RIFCSPLOWO2_12_FULL_39_13]HCC30378.1 hypothetical protein [Marinilabiliales bacterium]